jgi:lysophospholipase L1-like esterase
MNFRRVVVLFLLATSLFLQSTPGLAAKAAPPDRWVGTWATSPMAEANADGRYGGADTTLREIVHVSLGGALVRVVLTNEFGTEPLTIGAVHVALSSGGGAIGLMSANAMTFGGKASITIPAGAMAVSDPAALTLPAFADVAVSIFVPAQTIHQVSVHGFADQTSFVSAGNDVNKAKLTDAKEITSWPFLKGVDVKVGASSASIVCLGDSITDGALSTRDANSRWPDLLARRLQGGKKTKDLGVLNQGIGGNRVLHDGTGPSALARFDRDVIAQAGVRYLVIMEGINDIGAAANPNQPHDVVTADDLIQAFGQMAERAHAHGIKVIGATLTPYVGAKYASPAGESMREALNAWIRTSKQLDGVIDFEKATRDPASPNTFGAFADSGDHLHPKDAGYKAMADSIDLRLFELNRNEKYDITRQE